MPQRAHYHHGDLRATLVGTALDQLEENGQAAISLRALAKAAGVSPNAPYRHFVDKNALMAALASEGFRRFADLIEAAGDRAAPIANLRAQGEAYLHFAATQPALYRLIFSPYGYSLHSESCQKESTRAFGNLITATARAQATGWKKEADLNTLVLAYWSSLHGWASLLIDRLVPPGVESPGATEWMDVFFDGQRG